jgi:hypothetical protein
VVVTREMFHILSVRATLTDSHFSTEVVVMPRSFGSTTLWTSTRVIDKSYEP